MLIILAGLPGVGKTTTSHLLSEALSAQLISIDVVRKRLFPDPTYHDNEQREVVGALIDEAENHLDKEESVILDAVFLGHGIRERMEQISEEKAVPFFVIEVVADVNNIRERLNHPRDDESDAYMAEYEKLKPHWQPIKGDHIVVENNGTVEALKDKVNEIVNSLNKN